MHTQITVSLEYKNRTLKLYYNSQKYYKVRVLYRLSQNEFPTMQKRAEIEGWSIGCLRAQCHKNLYESIISLKNIGCEA